MIIVNCSFNSWMNFFPSNLFFPITSIIDTFLASKREWKQGEACFMRSSALPHSSAVPSFTNERKVCSLFATERHPSFWLKNSLISFQTHRDGIQHAGLSKNKLYSVGEYISYIVLCDGMPGIIALLFMIDHKQFITVCSFILSRCAILSWDHWQPHVMMGYETKVWFQPSQPWLRLDLEDVCILSDNYAFSFLK